MLPGGYAMLLHIHQLEQRLLQALLECRVLSMS